MVPYEVSFRTNTESTPAVILAEKPEKGAEKANINSQANRQCELCDEACTNEMRLRCYCTRPLPGISLSHHADSVANSYMVKIRSSRPP